MESVKNEMTKQLQGCEVYDEFVAGPFTSYESAVVDARRRNTGDLNLIVWNEDTFFDLEGEPAPNGNIIVIDTDGQLWVSGQERPVNAPVQ